MRAVEGSVVKQVVTAGNYRFILLGERWDSGVIPLEISLLKLESADVSTHLRAEEAASPALPCAKELRVLLKCGEVGRPPGNIC